ncbi:hypothetical protein IE81DRAFT_350093 [Ceraceosorus guamensis]|uniref:Uncharacterized protein n=1 Tax=Ceraceosorus guamensis TaxID=1522189 RepID=A0A316VPS5_9BASI|nr:hypothetical protein IE81DRAFT_350093 [Ceraceosorus guamensis]PWN39522.1 hypothetical protein IE81DRAFT_350093 [Ceraceosorus guamensis]
MKSFRLTLALSIAVQLSVITVSGGAIDVKRLLADNEQSLLTRAKGWHIESRCAPHEEGCAPPASLEKRTLGDKRSEDPVCATPGCKSDSPNDPSTQT